MTDTKTNTENVEVKKDNPLIARSKLPGQTFALPSGGIFYTNEELDKSVENGEIHIHPMAAFDEVLIKTPSLLLDGQAVEKVFTRCIPQINKPMQLLAKDVDFILIALRQVTYGNFMDITYKHTCKDAKEHNYQVDISQFIQNAKKINPVSVGKMYHVKLEKDGIAQTVELRPATYKEIVDMLQMFTIGQEDENDMSGEATMRRAVHETESLLKSIMSVIKSVDGNDDRDNIYEWLQEINAKWVENLTDSVEKTSNWGPKFDHKTKCKDCNKNIVISVPINPISFFT